MTVKVTAKLVTKKPSKTIAKTLRKCLQICLLNSCKNGYLNTLENASKRLEKTPISQHMNSALNDLTKIEIEQILLVSGTHGKASRAKQSHCHFEEGGVRVNFDSVNEHQQNPDKWCGGETSTGETSMD